MRQLVSVVTDQSVHYFLAEDGSDEVQQVASVLNTGLQVPDVIDLGANLLQSLRLNGHRVRPVAAPAPTPALPPAPVKAAPPVKARKPPPQKRARNRSWGFGQDVLLSDLRAHPGTTYRDAAQRIAGTHERAALTAYSASLSLLERKLTARGARVRRETFTAPDDVTGANRTFARLYLEEPEPRAEEEAAP